jgi:hypothetical protein
MSLDSPKTTEEHYTAAVGHGQLTVDLARRTPADYIIASGMSGAHLGAALINLRSEYDSAGKPKQPGAEMEAFYRRLQSYNTVYALLLEHVKGRVNIHIPAALHYWLDQSCPACTGRGLEVVPGTARLSGRHCKACAGTKTKSMIEPSVRAVLAAIDAAQLAHRSGMVKKLADKKFDENVAILP